MIEHKYDFSVRLRAIEPEVRLCHFGFARNYDFSIRLRAIEPEVTSALRGTMSSQFGFVRLNRK